MSRTRPESALFGLIAWEEEISGSADAHRGSPALKNRLPGKYLKHGSAGCVRRTSIRHPEIAGTDSSVSGRKFTPAHCQVRAAARSAYGPLQAGAIPGL